VCRAVFRDEGMVPALVEGMQMYKLDTTGPDAYQPISQQEIKQVSSAKLIFVLGNNLGNSVIFRTS